VPQHSNDPRNGGDSDSDFGERDSRSEDDDEGFTLGNPRETVLRHLARRDESETDVQLLAVAVWEHERESRDAGPDELSIETVQRRLTSEHLPALNRTDLVAYDRVEDTVALTATTDEVEQYLGLSRS